VYYALMLRCWHLVWILVRTDHLCLGVGCHNAAEGGGGVRRREGQSGGKREGGTGAVESGSGGRWARAAALPRYSGGTRAAWTGVADRRDWVIVGPGGQRLGARH
jgi:hypothetical protein